MSRLDADQILYEGINAVVKYNFAHNGVEIYFNGIPEKDVRESLKVLGWRWLNQKKCWYNRFNTENEQIAMKLAGNKVVDEDECHNEPDYENDYFIGVEDIVVISRGAVCIYNEHPLEKVMAWVNVLTTISQKEVPVPVLHCKKCGVYYMMELDFQELKGNGHLLCRMIEDVEYKKIILGGAKWAPVSVMRSYGYTVNANDNLSDNDRKRLLEFLVANEIMTEPQIINFLTWLIIRGNDNPRLQKAVAKWRLDRDYVLDSMDTVNSIRVRSIYRKKSVIDMDWDELEFD